MPFPYQSFREWLDDEEKEGNVLRIKTPIKCGDYSHLVENELQEHNPGLPESKGLLKGVIPETELRATVAYLHSLPNNPIGIIEKPVDNRPEFPIVTNLWPNHERTLKGMGLKTKEEFVQKLPTVFKKKIKPVVVARGKAPCKEVVIKDDKLDLRKDIPRVWVEFNKLCFSGCNGTIVSFDPKTGSHGLTKTRLGLFDWDNGDPKQAFPEEKVRRYGFATMARPGRPGQGNTGRFYFNNYRTKGQTWPAVFVYGLPTDMHVLAGCKTIKWPENGDEYEMVGGFRNQPVELVESETVPGLMVPATAEWVIEGEFVNEDYVTPEFSEDLAIGVVWGQALWPVFKIKCITHRKKPLWDATTFSCLGHVNNQGTHSGLLIGQNADKINMLRAKGYKVRDIVEPGLIVSIIQLEVDGINKPHAGYGKEVGMALGNKYNIVVGPDINPYNLTEVMWAISIRAGRNEWKDYPEIPGAPPMPRYGMYNSIMTDLGFTVIDATIPVPDRFEMYPPRCEPSAWEDAAAALMKKKIER
jgi:4-hydroxy-3-polyprenylbenzoate decarboxylase